MALTFSEKFYERVGRKKWKIYEVTHDGSVTTINASDVGLNYITYAFVCNKGALSSVADYSYLSGNAYGEYVVFQGALSSGAVDVLDVKGT